MCFERNLSQRQKVRLKVYVSYQLSDIIKLNCERIEKRGGISLLLQAKDHFDKHIIEEGFFGQEINHTTYNLARMNMFLHNINYDKFNIVLGNTLLNPQLGDDKPFDAIVSNPPYSVSWIGSDDPTLINDDRFAPASDYFNNRRVSRRRFDSGRSRCL